MTEHHAGYAVFLFDQAIEALGEPVKPYLQDGPAGPHIACDAVDTGGAFVELTLTARCDDGSEAEVELMIPVQMVRMIVSMRSDGVFGFAAREVALRATPLPVVGPDAPAPRDLSASVPATSAAGGVQPGMDDRRRPPEG
jgi:hypothetical protein